MMPSAETILDGAWHAASRRASCEEMAVACVAALRRLHQVIEESAGETGAAIFRGCIRQLALQAALRHLGRVQKPTAALPDAMPSARLACAMLEDAANSCVALNAAAEDNGPLCHATEFLVERLFALLGGMPDANELIDQIVAPDRPFVTITVPADCACPIN